MFILAGITKDVLVFLGLMLVVVRLVAYFVLSKAVIRIKKHINTPFSHMKSSESGKGNIELAIKAKNAKLYRKALPWAAILLWWPFVPRKRVFKAFNKDVLFFDWDPNPFIWHDLRRGSAEPVYLTDADLQKAMNLFENIVPV